MKEDLVNYGSFFSFQIVIFHKHTSLKPKKTRQFFFGLNHSSMEYSLSRHFRLITLTETPIGDNPVEKMDEEDKDAKKTAPSNHNYKGLSYQNQPKVIENTNVPTMVLLQTNFEVWIDGTQRLYHSHHDLAVHFHKR